MKTFSRFFCGFALLGWHCFAGGEINPFVEPQEPPPKPVIPVRGVLKLPQSVIHKRLGNDQHEYRIAGLYPPAKGKDPADSASYCAGTFGYLLSEDAEVKAEIEGATLIIRADEMIPYDTLAYAVDWVASGGGQVPTWVELESRDLKRAEQFDLNHYQITTLEKDAPKGLAWLGMSRTKELRIPIFTKLWNTGTLLVSPTTAQCMCHSKFAIRILDEDGKLIWEKADLAYGSVQVAMADTDGDRIHEAYFKTYDHGKDARYVLKPISDTDHIPIAPESKPEAKGKPATEKNSKPPPQD